MWSGGSWLDGHLVLDRIDRGAKLRVVVETVSAS